MYGDETHITDVRVMALRFGGNNWDVCCEKVCFHNVYHTSQTFALYIQLQMIDQSNSGHVMEVLSSVHGRQVKSVEEFVLTELQSLANVESSAGGWT